MGNEGHESAAGAHVRQLVQAIHAGGQRRWVAGFKAEDDDSEEAEGDGSKEVEGDGSEEVEMMATRKLHICDQHVRKNVQIDTQVEPAQRQGSGRPRHMSLGWVRAVRESVCGG